MEMGRHAQERGRGEAKTPERGGAPLLERGGWPCEKRRRRASLVVTTNARDMLSR